MNAHREASGAFAVVLALEHLDDAANDAGGVVVVDLALQVRDGLPHVLRPGGREVREGRHPQPEPRILYMHTTITTSVGGMKGTASREEPTYREELELVDLAKRALGLIQALELRRAGSDGDYVAGIEPPRCRARRTAQSTPADQRNQRWRERMTKKARERTS